MNLSIDRLILLISMKYTIVVLLDCLFVSLLTFFLISLSSFYFSMNK
jgi:hypothetical protein